MSRIVLPKAALCALRPRAPPPVPEALRDVCLELEPVAEAPSWRHGRRRPPPPPPPPGGGAGEAQAPATWRARIERGEGAWAPRRAQPAAADPEKEMRSMLNKIAPNNFAKLAPKLVERGAALAPVLVAKALDERTLVASAEVYVQLARRMDDEARRALLNAMGNAWRARLDAPPPPASLEGAALDEWNAGRGEEVRAARARNIVALVAHMCKAALLPPAFALRIAREAADARDVDAAFFLLNEVGRALDQELGREACDGVWETLSEAAQGGGRTKFMARDLAALRARGWRRG